METTPNYAATAAPPLPIFITQKIVQAAKIIAVHPDPHGDEFGLEFENNLAVVVDRTWMERRCGPSNPVGGYFVRYPDGYTSWSPAAAFEASATPAADYGLPLQQEPKYTIGAKGRIVNRATGEAIPDGEPIMILRAKDTLALAGAVLPYRDSAEYLRLPESIRKGAADRVHAFAGFRAAFPQTMKDPT
jgi:hypothetical protein